MSIISIKPTNVAFVRWHHHSILFLFDDIEYTVVILKGVYGDIIGIITYYRIAGNFVG